MRKEAKDAGSEEFLVQKSSCTAKVAKWCSVSTFKAIRSQKMDFALLSKILALPGGTLILCFRFRTLP
eukprot:2225636-Rhodomonas_salina.1